MKTRYLAGALFTLAALPVYAQTPVLTIYTYDGFNAEWGPGPQIEAAFEQQCGCDLQFVSAGDGAAMLARLRLEGQNTDADIVLGLDTNLIPAAKDSGLFAPAFVPQDLNLPVQWSDDTFIPFDWGYFAFVSTTDTPAPRNFKALAQSDISIVIQDPRSSTPGLGLAGWVAAAYGDEASDIWAALADNIVTVTPGWSESYGLFLQGEADAVLSYTTSPAYHEIAENDSGKTAWIFDEGHAMQIEVAARLAGSYQPDLALQFLNFMLTPAFQQVIPTTNWMYPAAGNANSLPAAFQALPRPAPLFSPPETAADMTKAVTAWREALTR